MADQDRQQIIRPTEGQLRWAQFHQKRRAQAVKEAVERLWQTPAAVAEVDGAYSDDGNTTEESVNSPLAKRERPKISRGRRALLRVSKRQFIRRRENVEKYGFLCAGDRRPADDDEDELAAIFAEESFRKRRRRRHMRRMATAEEERVRRFEDAFHAMMMNLVASQPRHPEEEIVPKRRWTRPDVAPAETVDGRAYADLKWGFIPKQPKAAQTTLTPVDRGASWLVHIPARSSPRHRIRRVVSSLSKIGRESPESDVIDEGCSDFDQSQTSVPLTRDFQEIIAFLQENLHQPTETNPKEMSLPKMKLQKFFVPTKFDNFPDDEKKDDDEAVRSLDKKFSELDRPSLSVEKRAKAISQRDATIESYAEEILAEIDSDLIADIEALDPGSSKKLFTRYLVETEFDPSRHDVRTVANHLEIIAKRYLVEIRHYSNELDGEDTSHNFLEGQCLVDRIVRRLDKAARDGEFVMLDGKLHKQSFCLLLLRYIDELNKNSRAQQADFSRESLDDFTANSARVQPSPSNDDYSSEIKNDQEFVDRFISSLEKADEIDYILDKNGIVNRNAAKALLVRYMSQTSNLDEQVVSTAKNLSDIRKLSLPNSKANSSLGPQGKQAIDKAVEDVDLAIQDGSIKISNQCMNPTDLLEVLLASFSDTFGERGHEGTFQSPIALSQIKKSAVAFSRSQLRSSTGKLPESTSIETKMEDIVQKLHLMPGRTRFITSKNRLDRGAFRNYLVDNLPRGVIPLHENRDVNLPNESPTSRSNQVRKTAHEFSPDDSDYFQKLLRDRNETTSPTTPQTKQSLRSSHVPITQIDETTNGTVKRLVGTVSSKFSGLLNKIGNKGEQSEEEELQAVAAFRKNRNERRKGEDTSSVSSFHVLPDGIMSVMKRFQEPALSPQNEVEDETFESYHSESLVSEEPLSVHSRQSSGYSPERARIIHQRVMERSALIGEAGPDGSIIDTDGSDVSGGMLGSGVVANLLLSPTILTKRHKQAIRAVESRQWDHVKYLINANPWLSEMTDLNTNQYLLHKLALFGAGEGAVDHDSGQIIICSHPAPMQLNCDLVRLVPTSVHKFDKDGNLPLHMACASANLPMIKLLGDRFSSGASVRNQDGMLPLHLSVLACSACRPGFTTDFTEVSLVRTVLEYFPGALAVVDNEGNIPLHMAASSLSGPCGVEIIEVLVDAAESQLRDPCGVRFRNHRKISASKPSLDLDSVDFEDEATSDDDELHCTEVVNDYGNTPLHSAITGRAGYEVIEALVSKPGALKAALAVDENGNNALHYLVGNEYNDPAAALSILKRVPITARQANHDGILPIEIACMFNAPRELILAIVLADLPLKIHENDNNVESGAGASWMYLTCDCDDHFVDVVDEVLTLCPAAQARALCLVENEQGVPLLHRSTPNCKALMRRQFRFAGRFELLGDAPINTDPTLGVASFYATDFDGGGNNNDAKRVLLRCYTNEERFLQETTLIRQNTFDLTLIEQVVLFDVEEFEVGGAKFCVSIEQPDLTLEGVVQGMLRNHECQTDRIVRERYGNKVFAVLRVVAKALRHLHARGVVHGSLCPKSCGKYGDKWKLGHLLSASLIGDPLNHSTMQLSHSASPECIMASNEAGIGHQAVLKPDRSYHPSIDSWGFGKLGYEVLVGVPLVQFEGNSTDMDARAMLDLLHWSEFNVEEIRENLSHVCVSDDAISLIARCLSPIAEERPTMDEVLKHAMWQELRGSRKQKE